MALHEALCGYVPLSSGEFWGKEIPKALVDVVDGRILKGSRGGVGGGGGATTKGLGELWGRQRVCSDLETVLSR